jgi:hypothetical protein
VRVERWFSFVDLSGFTSFGDQFGDDESVRVLTVFRASARQVATDFACGSRSGWATVACWCRSTLGS